MDRSTEIPQRMKISFQILIILSLFSCQSKNDTIVPIAIANTDSAFSLEDTLNKYSDTDSIFKYENRTLYIGCINKEYVSLDQFNDSTTILLHKTNGRWLLLDTINYPICDVQKADLNGDNNSDLVLTYLVTGSGGNSQNISFLYDPTKRSFYHNHYFDLPNIRYDKEAHLVYSAWWSGVVNPQNKMVYRLSADSLVFKEGVTYIPDETSSGDIGTVQFYQIKNNKRKVTKSIKGKADNMCLIFCKALWNSCEE